MLVALSKVRRTHVTNLVRMTNSTYNQITRNLEIMENEGIIRVQHCGNMKIIELQLNNPKTEKLLKALHTLQLPFPEVEAPKPLRK